MADPAETPEEVLKRTNQELGRTWGIYKHLRDSQDQRHDSELAAAKATYEVALEAYKQARRDYLPLSPAEGIKPPPVARAAYSDRMAWLMANMANLAYVRFDSGRRAGETDWEARQKAEIERLEFCLRSGIYRGPDEEEKPIDEGLSFDLLRIFDTSADRMRGFRETDTQGFLAKCATFAVLAFRGTEPTRFADVWTDLQAYLRRTREGRVHTGFRAAYAEVRDEIRAALPAIGDLPLYITGHSLGAALATVAAQDLDQDPDYRDQLAACYTFGSPRVGDGKYEGRLKIPVYRMVHAADIVTLIPFFFGTYVHVGDPRYLSRNTKGRILYRGVPFVRRVWEAILEMALALLRLRNPLLIWVEAHSMAHYIWKLKRIARAKNTY